MPVIIVVINNAVRITIINNNNDGPPKGLQMPLDKATLALRAVIRRRMERSMKGETVGALKFKLTAVTGRNRPPAGRRGSLVSQRAANHSAALVPRGRRRPASVWF